MADVTLKYKGATIAELSETGNKTIETAGQYCEDDILLEYVKSGGSVLPSVISKIDGGSFTLNADTQCSNHWIDHNLGVVPKQVVIWTEDETLVNAATQGDKKFVIYVQMLVREYVTGNANDNSLYPVYIYRNTDGKAANIGNPATVAQKSLYVSSTQAKLYTAAVYYKANTEYKWIAFA